MLQHTNKKLQLSLLDTQKMSEITVTPKLQSHQNYTILKLKMDKHHSLTITECQSMQTNSVTTSYIALLGYIFELYTRKKEIRVNSLLPSILCNVK